MLDLLNGQELFNRADELRQKRGWSLYELAQHAGVSATTIYNWRDNLSIPSLQLLESICSAFDMSLYNFLLDENELMALTDEQKELVLLWNKLSRHQKNLVIDLMKEF